MYDTDEDGTTNNLVTLPRYMVWNNTSKRGGALRGLKIKIEREEESTTCCSSRGCGTKNVIFSNRPNFILVF